MIILKYAWIVILIIIDFILWAMAYDSYKESYRKYSCTDDYKIKRIFDGVMYSDSMAAMVFSHLLILFIISFIYWVNITWG